MTPVLLGAIELRTRTRLEGLKVYLGSLRWQNPDIRVVLFNRSPANEALASLLRRYDVEAIDAVVFDHDHNIPSVEIEIARFLQYRAWLAENASDDVVMTDVLDVVFQNDPLTIVPETGLVVYQENNLLGRCPYNRKWMREVWPDLSPEYLNHPIVCCGVLAGDGAGARAYLDWYAEQFALRPSTAIRRGFDSAAINGYAYTAPGVGLTAFLNDECMHLGYARPEGVTDDGVVRCEDVAPVLVHQYNRHPVVTRGLYDRWI